MDSSSGFRRVLLIGDSFGTARQRAGQMSVSEEGTWPRQVERAVTSSVRITADFKPFRRLVDCVDVVHGHGQVDLLLIQAGIVDCYPRPLPLGPSHSRHTLMRVARKLIRPVRRGWVNYVHRTAWSTGEAVRAAAFALCRQTAVRRIGFITPTPVCGVEALRTPGAQEAIFDFNDILREATAFSENAFVLDLHAELLRIGYRTCLDPVDSHLNQRGNDVLSRLVLATIGTYLGADAVCPKNDQNLLP